ncbi:MAG TPA: hypothetical protein VHT73_15945 [Thermodesulfobacteriota bacterium]|nr:hypothetical protein [Thermodesulfobacteriota bacterium]
MNVPQVTKCDDPSNTLSFKILSARYFEHDHSSVWVVEMLVGNLDRDVKGWAFLERDFIELRFERYPAMEPPGFISGKYFSYGIDDSSLEDILDHPSEYGIQWIESNIRQFLRNCTFCVRALADTESKLFFQEAESYRYKKEKIPITGVRRSTS